MGMVIGFLPESELEHLSDVTNRPVLTLEILLGTSVELSVGTHPFDSGLGCWKAKPLPVQAGAAALSGASVSPASIHPGLSGLQSLPQ
jgi:hypothetical protein